MPRLAAARRGMPRLSLLVAVAGRPDAGSSSRPSTPRLLCGIAPFWIRTLHSRNHPISRPYALACDLGRDSIERGGGGVVGAFFSSAFKAGSCLQRPDCRPGCPETGGVLGGGHKQTLFVPRT